MSSWVVLGTDVFAARKYQTIEGNPASRRKTLALRQMSGEFPRETSGQCEVGHTHRGAALCYDFSVVGRTVALGKDACVVANSSSCSAAR